MFVGGVVCSDEGLTLEMLAKHHIPQAKNITYQPLLIKPVFSVLAHAETQFFSKLVFQCLLHEELTLVHMRSRFTFTDCTKLSYILWNFFETIDGVFNLNYFNLYIAIYVI